MNILKKILSEPEYFALQFIPFISWDLNKLTSSISSLSFSLKYIWINLTYSCNLSCAVCGLWGDTGVWKKKKRNDLKFSDIKNFIDEVSKYRPMVLLTGGEPFLNEEWVKIAQYLKEKKLRVSVSTNGTYIQKYKKEIIDFVDVLDISLDGIGDVHNKIRGKDIFEDVVSGTREINTIKKEKKYIKPYIKISFTVQEANFFKIVETIRYMDKTDIEIDCFIIRHLQFSTPEKVKEHQEIFKKEFGENAESLSGFLYSPDKIDLIELKHEIRNVMLEKTKNIKEIRFEPPLNTEEVEKFYKNPSYIPSGFKKCFAPYLGINITPDGDIWLCPDYCIGNVKKDRFKDIWNSKKSTILRKKIKHIGLFPLCRVCAGLYVY